MFFSSFYQKFIWGGGSPVQEDVSYMELVIGLIVVVVIVVVISSISENNKKNSDIKSLNSAIDAQRDFSDSQRVFSVDRRTGILIDEKRKKLGLFTKAGDSYHINVIPYRDVLCSEVFEDGLSVTSTNRGSQVGGALIGGLALGGVGAIIGGLSGKTTSKNTIQRIDVRITINSTSSPIFDLNFLNESAGVGKDSEGYKSASNSARRWQGVLSAVIRQADVEDEQARKNDAHISSAMHVNSNQLFCQECGGNITAQSKFCPQCGKEIIAIQSIQEGSPAESSASAAIRQEPTSIDQPTVEQVLAKAEIARDLRKKRERLSLVIICFVVFIVVFAFNDSSSESPVGGVAGSGRPVGAEAAPVAVMTEEERQRRIIELTTKVKALPAKPYLPNLNIYRELLSLDSSNKLYQKKVSYYQRKISEEALRVKVLAVIAKSDDLNKYESVFVEETVKLISSKRCTPEEIQEQGGWTKSVVNHKVDPTYFIFCGGMHRSNRLYLNVVTKAIFS